MYKIINDVLEKIPDEEIKNLAEQQAEYEKTEEYKQFKISELKQKLTETDYIACKIAEGSATREEYSEIIAQREIWREEINRRETKAMVESMMKSQETLE